MNYLKEFAEFILETSTSKMTKFEFIRLATKKYGKLYDYSHLTNEINIDMNTPIRISCKIHGPFNSTPLKHLGGKGCPECYTANTPKKITDQEGYEITTTSDRPKAFYQAKPHYTKNMIRRN